MRHFAALRYAVAAGVLALTASACGGSAKTPTVAVPASPIPTQAAPSPSPAIVTTPPKTVTAPKAKPTLAALSAYENDPAVKDLRAYYVAAARAINARNFRLLALVALSTPGRAARHPTVFMGDVGLFIPGPVPFTPLGVRTVAAGHKQVLWCGVEEGWSLTKKGGRPARPYRVVALRSDQLLTRGHWIIDHIRFVTGTSCQGVTIVRRTFA